MNANQIAAEVEGILPLGNTPLDKKVRVEQIQSAIEKALVDYDSRDAYNFGYEQGLKARAASEPWTVETLETIWDELGYDPHNSSRFFERVVALHNASISSPEAVSGNAPTPTKGAFNSGGEPWTVEELTDGSWFIDLHDGKSTQIWINDADEQTAERKAKLLANAHNATLKT